MRSLLFLLLVYSITSVCFGQHGSFTIKGRINQDSKAEKIFLEGPVVIEIPIGANKEFTYRGDLKEPDFFFIKTDKSFSWRLWIAKGDIDVTLQEWEFNKPDSAEKKFLKIISISGPPETEKGQWFLEQINVVGSRFSNITMAQHRDSMSKYYDPLLEAYIKDHRGSKFSVHIAGLAYNRENKAKLLSLINKELTKDETLSLEKAEQREKITKPGSIIENFQMKSLKGELFSLSKLSSKYILLDFWASWCGPCRYQHPALIKIYNEFQKKGFEIVGVSLDDSKSAWEKAVSSDKLPWINVSELEGWENSLAQKYFVTYIPFNILVDKDKRIIASGLDPHALAEKLNELLNK